MTRRLLPISLGFFLIGLPAAGAEPWRPVTPRELALQQSPIEKDAEAEALFWDIRVLDEAQNNEYPHTVMTHYIRMKIFTEQGKDKHGTVILPYGGKIHISDISGRTIQPDGTVIELGKDAIFDKNVISANGLKIRARTFAMPAVERGSIIEYQWREDKSDQLANHVPLPLQGDLPIEEITYHVKPITSPWFPYRMRFLSLNGATPSFQPEGRGYYALSVRAVPAFHREPLEPPDNALRQWALVYYEPDQGQSEDQYWNTVGKELYQNFKSEIKVNDDVKRIAETAMQGATTPEDKIAHLAEYCRKNIKDVHGEEITLQERDKAKKNNTTVDTLRRGEGTAYQINLAFASLVQAAGFEARLARLPDRGDTLFSRHYLTPYFLRSSAIAVNLAGKWQFYDVSNRNLPNGMLRWQEEGVEALISDSRNPSFVLTPITPAQKSRTSRMAQFTLDAEGTLEGDVREVLSGHEALNWRSRFAADTPAEQEQALRRSLVARYHEARITDVKFSVPDDPASGAAYTYHIKVPGYAQRTGKRLFLIPAFFEIGMRPRFPESKREHPIYFHFPWSETDSVTIKLPENYDLDHADAPASLGFPPSGEYKVRIAVSKDRQIIYERNFVMGADGNILFDVQNYPALKRIFDQVHERDGHMLTLKVQGEPGAAASQSGN